MSKDTIYRQDAIDAFWKLETELRPSAIDAVLDMLKYLPSAQPEPQWIPCSERTPEEDYWLGGSGKQFSENVMVTIVNHSDEDTWVDMTYTVDGEWMLELPRHCEITAWMPKPKPYDDFSQYMNKPEGEIE